MGLFDNYQLPQAQPIPTYTGIPLEQYEDTTKQLQENYYRNVADMDKLQIMAENMPMFDADIGERERAVGYIKDVLSDIAKKGDRFENATSQVRQLAKKFATDQRLNEARNRYQQSMEHLKELDERYKKGEISENAYRYAKAVISQYPGLDKAENFSQYLFNPANYFDVQTAMDEFGKGWKESASTRGWRPTGDGRWIKNDGTYIDEEEVRQTMKSYATTNPEAVSSIRTELAAMGVQPNQETIESYVSPFVEQQVKKLGFAKVDQEMKFEPGYEDMRSRMADMNYDIAIQIPGSEFTSVAAMESGIKGFEDKVKELLTETEMLTKQLENDLISPEEYTVGARRIYERRNQLNNKKRDLKKKRDYYIALAEARTGKKTGEFTEEELKEMQDDVIAALAYTKKIAAGPFGYPEPITKEEVNNRMAELMGIKDPVIKLANELAKKDSEPTTTSITVFPSIGSKNWVESMERYGRNVIGQGVGKPGSKNAQPIGRAGADASTQGLKWASTQKSGQLKPDEVANIHTTSYVGFAIDPTVGKPVLLYNVYDANGTANGIVSMPVPRGTVSNMISKGDLDGAKASLEVILSPLEQQDGSMDEVVINVGNDEIVVEKTPASMAGQLGLYQIHIPGHGTIDADSKSTLIGRILELF